MNLKGNHPGRRNVDHIVDGLHNQGRDSVGFSTYLQGGLDRLVPNLRLECGGPFRRRRGISSEIPVKILP
ncbi:MAG TPA: hypothetical protein VKE70_26300 [Candidatus Solibacter sp.]|nr:hypothetical protein [Candidatus Solibacter sp.]